MSATCNTDILLEIERAKKKYQQINIINSLLEQSQYQSNSSNNTLVLIIKEIMEQQQKD